MSLMLRIVKAITILAFMVTLFATYFLRQEVLVLNEIRFSAEDLRAEDDLRATRESYPNRVASYEIEVKNYELQKAHYEEMMRLYQTDYEAYARRLEDKYEPPQVPYPPSKPTPPDENDRFLEINTRFRQQQHHYFSAAATLNWVVCCAAMLLCGGLLFLIMFEEGPQRFAYLAVLFLSFAFMIGPSFYSIMSAIVGFLHPPRGY